MFLSTIGHLVCYCIVMMTWSALAMTNETLHLDSGVVELGISNSYNRIKRQVHKGMVGFNKEQRQAILKRHNELRSKSEASNMMMMLWDSELEKLAFNWAQQCKFLHSENRRNVAGYKYVGENLFAGTGEFDPASVVQAWFDEIKDYDYRTQRCEGVCGHYTQVAWASSKALGCSVKYCEYLEGAQKFHKGYNYVCHYGPGGNIRGQKPFLKGKACSECPSEISYCVRGLCASMPQIGSRSCSIQIARFHRVLLCLASVVLYFISSTVL